MIDLVWFLLIGLCAGWLAGQLTQGRGYGWQGDLIVGVIGALIGGTLFWIVGFQAVHLLGRLISATVGAVLLLMLLRAVRPGGGTKRRRRR